MSVLVTAFEPFAGRSENQSKAVAEPLAEAVGADFLELPVTFEGCFLPIQNWLRKNKETSVNTLIFSLGEAPVETVQMEQVALNKMHAPCRGDNSGRTPVNQSIHPQKKLALESSYSPEKVLNLFEGLGDEFRVSYSAGQYVCNCLYWNLLDCERSQGVRSMFFHVPVKMDLNLKANVLEKLIFFIEAAKRGEL